MAKAVENKLFSCVSNFLQSYLPDQRKRSPNTIRSYRKSLELLFDFVKEKQGVKLNEITFDMIDRKTIEAFLSQLEKGRNCGVSTQNQRLQCIRAFYSYAADVEITAVSHWDKIKKIRIAAVPQSLVPHMSEEAIAALLEQPDKTTIKGLRDFFIMLFLYQTGARVQELLDVCLCDIRLGNTNTAVLHGKGGKVRAVPLREKFAEHLREYVSLFHSGESEYSKRHFIYVVHDGVKKRMTEDNVRRLVHAYGKSAKTSCSAVPDNVHPHLFRHSRAMHLYQNGVDLTLVSQWLGHSKLDTTLIYAYADTEHKRKAIAAAIPEESPLSQYINTERYCADDDEIFKRFCGLK